MKLAQGCPRISMYWNFYVTRPRVPAQLTLAKRYLSVQSNAKGMCSTRHHASDRHPRQTANHARRPAVDDIVSEAQLSSLAGAP